MEALLKSCRLCMKEKFYGIDIFQGKSGEEPYFQTVFEIFRIELNEKKNWPSLACRQCIRLLGELKEFKGRICATQEKLETLLAPPPPDTAVKRQRDIEDARPTEVVVKSQLAAVSPSKKSSISIKSKVKKETEPNPPSPAGPMTPDNNDEHSSSDSDSDSSSSSSSSSSLSISSIELPSSPEVAPLRRPNKRPVREHCCETCGKVVTTKYSLRKHVLTHLPPEQRPSHICENCGKTFPSMNCLKQHMNLSHTERQSQECTVCHKFFFNVKKHMTHRHSAEGTKKTTKCHICSREVIYDRLSRHIQLAHGEKKHICEICGKAFATPKGLKEHEYTHTGVRIECLFCPHTSLGNRNLTTHMRQQHLEEYEAYKAKRKSVPEVKNEGATVVV